MRFLNLVTIIVLHQGLQVEGKIRVQNVVHQRLTLLLELGTCPFSGTLATSSKLVPVQKVILKSLHPKDALVHQDVEQALMVPT